MQFYRVWMRGTPLSLRFLFWHRCTKPLEPHPGSDGINRIHKSKHLANLTITSPPPPRRALDIAPPHRPTQPLITGMFQKMFL